MRSLEELEYLIRSSGEGGTLHPEAYSVLRRALRFGDQDGGRRARAPGRRRLAPRSTPPPPSSSSCRCATGHSRFPVCRGDLDDVAGVVHVKDVYRLPFEERATTPVRDPGHRRLRRARDRRPRRPARAVPPARHPPGGRGRRVRRHRRGPHPRGRPRGAGRRDRRRVRPGARPGCRRVLPAGTYELPGHAAPRRGGRGLRLRAPRGALRDAGRLRARRARGASPNPAATLDHDGLAHRGHRDGPAAHRQAAPRRPAGRRLVGG